MTTDGMEGNGRTEVTGGAKGAELREMDGYI